MTECNIDEILKQLKVLDSLRLLRENMGNGFFKETFPELNDIDSKLDALIAKQEAELNTRMSECGNITSEELPEVSEPILEDSIPVEQLPEI